MAETTTGKKLFQAIVQGDLPSVKKYFENGLDCNSIYDHQKNQYSPLHVAVIFRREDIVRYLVLEKKVDLDKRSAVGETALHKAAFHGHLNILKFLLENNADCSAVSVMGESVLHYAVTNDHVEILRYLVEEQKVDASPRTKRGITPLRVASLSGSNECFKFLVDLGEDYMASESEDCGLCDLARNGNRKMLQYLIDEKNLDVTRRLACSPGGQYLLHLACGTADVDTVKFLIEKGADCKALSYDGGSCLHFAAYFGNVKTVKYLVEEKMMDINQCERLSGKNSLHFACNSGSLDTVKFLFEKGCISADTERGLSCLQFAACFGNTSIVRYLIEEKQADVNKRTTLSGRTALHVACQSGCLDTVKLIIEKGGNCNAIDNAGQIPFAYALNYGRSDVAMYLYRNRLMSEDSFNYDYFKQVMVEESKPHCSVFIKL